MPSPALKAKLAAGRSIHQLARRCRYPALRHLPTGADRENQQVTWLRVVNIKDRSDWYPVGATTETRSGAILTWSSLLFDACYAICLAFPTPGRAAAGLYWQGLS